MEKSEPDYFFGSLIFWPTLRAFQFTPGFTACSAPIETPLALAIFMPLSPGLTTYSPGPATAGSPPFLPAAGAGAGFFADSSSLVTDSCSLPRSGPTWRPHSCG